MPNNHYWETIKCPVCQKHFIPALHHVYREARGKRKRLVCSYKCVCESERIEKARRAEKAKKSTPKPEGYTMTEAEELMHLPYNSVYKMTQNGQIRYEMEYTGKRKKMYLNKTDVDEYIRRQHESTN